MEALIWQVLRFRLLSCLARRAKALSLIATCLALAGLLHSPAPFAAPGDCILKGGNTTCAEPVYAPWSYTYVDDALTTNASYINAVCVYWYLSGYNGQTCPNPSPITPSNMSQRALNFARRIGPNCPYTSHTEVDWLQPGQTIVMQDGRTLTMHQTGGVEDSNYKQFFSTVTYGTGCASSVTSRNIVRRYRSATLTCPIGFTKRTNNGQAECTREQEEVTCPTTQADSCANGDAAIGRPAREVGNPISIGLGSKRQTETDYIAAGNSALRFVRSYHSNAGFNVPGYPEGQTSSMGGYWRTNFDRYIYPLTPNTHAMAAVIRPGGYLKHFDNSGSELASPTQTRERLEKLMDAGGVIAGWRYYNAADEVELYDNSGRLQSITNRRGHTQTLTYSDASTLRSIAAVPGLLIKVQDDFGRRLDFAYDASNRLASMTNPAGESHRYEYDGLGNLQYVTLPTEAGTTRRRQYHYENVTYKRALTGITDENGLRYARCSYDSLGRAISSEHADGTGRNTLSFGSNSTSVTNPLGAVTTHSFSSHNGVRRNTSISKSCEGCNGNVTSSTTYDTNGFISSRTDFSGNVIHYTHDARGLETSRTEAAGTALARTITTTWHPTFRLPIEINEPGRRTAYTYDNNGNRLSQTITDLATNESRTTAYSYTGQGLLDTVNGPRQDVEDITDFDYDQQGNLIAYKNALNQVTLITAHDAHGNPLVVIDPNGIQTEFAYDLQQRVVSRTEAGASTRFEYDMVGNLARVTRPNESFISYSYDDARRVVGITDNAGNRITYTLDAAGNRVKQEVFDPNGALKRRLQHEYDSDSQLRRILGANGQVTALGYDAVGNPVSQTDANTFTTHRQYDALGRVHKITDAANGETHFTYDALGHLISVTDPNGHTTRYTVNAFGEAIQVLSPDTGTASYRYDKAGNLISRTDARDVTVDYYYDALDRLTFIDYPGTTEDVRYVYDGTNYGQSDALSSDTANPIGHLTGVTDPSGTTSYAYNPRGIVVEQARIILNVIYRTRYSYDASSNLTSITYPNGRIVSLDRDALGQVGRLETLLGRHTMPLAEQMTYLPFGPAFSSTLGNGLASQKSYDLDYRVIQIQAGELQALNYYYDDRDNIEAIQNSLDANTSQNFAYDALGRLHKAQGSYGTRDYGYDAVGNRLYETVSAPNANPYTLQYAYANDSHRLQAITGNGTNTSMTYDAAGNTTRMGDMQFTYNQANRLSQVSKRKPLGGYVYNSQGQRVIKTAGNTTTVYHHDLDGLLIAETDAQGNLQKEYIYLNGQPLTQLTYRKKGKNVIYDTYYYHLDHLGTPQLMSDTSGQIVWKASYEPFGEPTITTNKRTEVVSNLRFPGQYADSETGLSDNWFRPYDPATGRYLQSDPIGLLGGINTYGYALQNPERYIDPIGLDTAIGLNGPTSSNPFGHTAQGFSGQGVFSYGTVHRDGSSFSRYVLEQAKIRHSTYYVFQTTPEQEAAMIQQYKDAKAVGPYDKFEQNCATVTSEVILEGNFGEYWNAFLRNRNMIIPPTINVLFGRAPPGEFVAVPVPRGTTDVPRILQQFDPRP